MYPKMYRKLLPHWLRRFFSAGHRLALCALCAPDPPGALGNQPTQGGQRAQHLPAHADPVVGPTVDVPDHDRAAHLPGRGARAAGDGLCRRPALLRLDVPGRDTSPSFSAASFPPAFRSS